MSGTVIEIIEPGVNTADGEEGPPVVVARAVYEHPFIVRLCHWINTVALFVMVGSGLQIFRAFPSFGAKIPQKDLLHWPKAFAIGGWLGGALQWHLTFMWIYMATGVLYLGYQIFSGNYRQVLFTPRDIPGVPRERNLKGVSFAVANATGFIARALEAAHCTGVAELFETLTESVSAL